MTIVFIFKLFHFTYNLLFNMKNNQKRENKINTSAFDTNDYQKMTYEDRINSVITKVKGCIEGDVTIINKLGFGGLGTVYRVNTTISGESVDIAQKAFYEGKDLKRAEDDYVELYNNWQITKYISKNIKTIAKDPFLCECIEKVPLLFTTHEQRRILEKENTPEEEYIAAQKASELKEGIFFEIKGNQNLEEIISSKKNELTFEDRRKLLLDILMGGTILDKVGIIQRDLNCENIQIDIHSNDGKPRAYLVDFGKAVHKAIIHIFDDDESKKRDYCGPFFYSAPPEAYDDEEKEEIIFGDKYNSFNIGLLMFPLFFDVEGENLMYNFKWSNNEDIVHHRKNLFECLDEIVDKLNKNRDKPYNVKQISFIKKIMSKLINTNVDKRANAEKVARKIYEKETEIIQQIAKERLSFNDMQKCNNYQMMTKNILD